MKVIKIILCILVFIIFYVIGSRCGMAKFANDKFRDLKVEWNNTVLKDLSYGDKEFNKYDLYLPGEKKKNYSLILHIHGGGFYGGDKNEGEILSKYFTSKGYVCASVNYTLMNKDNISNINIMYDEIVIAVDDIIKVSKEKGYNITEMATTGESAGGCLAMLFAFRYGEDSPVPIRFVMQESGPTSFVPKLWADVSNQEKIDFINNMTGENFKLEDFNSEEYKSAINKISPSSYINENTIPLLLAYGANDMVVLPKVKEPFLDALDKNNVKHDYILFQNSGHSLYNDPDKLKDYHNKMNEYVEKYFVN